MARRAQTKAAVVAAAAVLILAPALADAASLSDFFYSKVYRKDAPKPLPDYVNGHPGYDLVGDCENCFSNVRFSDWPIWTLTTYTACDCQSECARFEDCWTFTFDTSNYECTHHQGFVTTECPTCISGQAWCPKLTAAPEDLPTYNDCDTSCHSSGRCNGNVITSLIATDACTCQSRCAENSGCANFLHDSSSNVCTLLDRCENPTTCVTCTNGPATCSNADVTTQSSNECTDCFDQSRCTGTVIDTLVTSSDCRCQSECKSNFRCDAFTFDTAGSLCSLHESCGNTTACATCSSGPQECSDTPTQAPGCQDCFETGRCVGQGVSTLITADDCACQAECAKNMACKAFTFDSNGGICIMMEDCNETSTCLSCRSGPAVCPEITTPAPACVDCFDAGRCVGTTLTSLITDIDCDCQAECAKNAECGAFTYDTSNKICTLTANCPETSICATCNNGPPECVAPTTPAPVCEDCFDAGRCTGTVLTSVITDDDCSCQAECAKNMNCGAFTFDSSNKICTLTSDCGSVASCITCVNGPPECAAPTQPPPVCEDCFEPGRCTGGILTSLITEIDCDCQAECAKNPNCMAFTYDSSNKICTLTDGCSSVSQCVTCVNGPPACPTPPECTDCFSDGRCTGSILNSLIAESDCKCQDECAKNEMCGAFTFDSSNQICSVHRECGSVNDCATCRNGPPSCPECEECFEPGRCQGTIIHTQLSNSSCECQADCLAWGDTCGAFTFDSSNRICSFTANCDNVAACATCEHGPPQCPEPPPACGDCFETGVCQGTVVTVDVAPELCDCVEKCRANLQCEYFTYNPGSNICTMTRDCPGGSNAEACPTCTSGPQECPTIPNCIDCSQQGTCRGAVVATTIANDICECKNTCQNSTRCDYLSYDSSTKICTETNSCDEVTDTTCPTCSWMPKQCGTEGCDGCLQPGQCNGKVLTVEFAYGPCDCYRRCQNLEQCQFFTHDDKENICTLASDCNGGIDTSCTTCQNGSRDCNLGGDGTTSAPATTQGGAPGPGPKSFFSHFLHF